MSITPTHKTERNTIKCEYKFRFSDSQMSVTPSHKTERNTIKCEFRF